jgi:PAS domain S-box-containing protein
MHSGRTDAESTTPPAAADTPLFRLAGLLARRRGPVECAAWLVTALAAATLLRIAVGVITTGAPLVFYFPAVSVVALFTGWECGAVAIVGSALLAWYLFLPPVLTMHVPTGPQTVILAFWILVGGTQVAIAHFLRLALQRSLHSETRYRKLLDAAAGTVWTANDRGEIEAPQANWAALTGMSWPAYAGDGWANAIHPEDRARLIELARSDAAEHRQVEARVWNAGAGDWRWYLARSVRLPRLIGEGSEWITSLTDIHEQTLASDRRNMIIGELRHRLKNLLTIIDALAKNSRAKLETDEQVEAFLKRFLGRLHALGAAADLVLAGKRVSIECGALVRATLSPFMEERAERFVLSGQDLYLSEETGGTLGLALHELATNAVKYGALSVPDGVVGFTWTSTRRDDGQEQVVLEWKEHGGPAPIAPAKEGFGTRLIRAVPARERGGKVQIQHDPDGFYCRISFLRPLDGPQAAMSRAAA